MADFAQGTLSTPVGELTVRCSQAGVTMVRFGAPPRPPAGQQAGPERARARLAEAVSQIGGYFGGQRRVFDVPVDWTGMTKSRQRVLALLHDRVGYGETVTYGELARMADLTAEGKMPPARAVGRIMGSNPVPVIVPCHRVVAGDGLGGYSGGTGVEIKRWLLTFEGSLPPTLDWAGG